MYNGYLSVANYGLPHSSCYLACWEFSNMARTCTVMNPRDSYQSVGGCGDIGKDAVFFFFFLIEQCLTKRWPMVTQLEEQNN